MNTSRTAPIFINNNEVTLELVEFHETIRTSHREKAKAMLTVNPSLAHFVIKPLYQSCLSLILLRKTIDYPMLVLLIENNVSLNIPISIKTKTPLEHACQTLDLKLCQFLIANKADVTPLAPHYLLSSSTSISFINQLPTVYQIIQLLGGLDKIFNMQDGKNISFKERASTCKIIHPDRQSIDYNLWDLLISYEKEQLEEKQKAQINDVLQPELSYIKGILEIIINYGLDRDISLDEKICQIKKSYEESNEIKYSPVYAFFSIGEKIIPEREVFIRPPQEYKKRSVSLS